ncbi:MAG: hypothetical protein FJW85_06585 [Actinobacteria bacterium]|jgi:hypothetical protein|nr:hypothetical protein [Actinomycetota bacterium]
MSRPVEEYAAQVARARRTARRVAVCAAISWSAGWIVIVACVIAWLGFGVSIIDSLEIMLAIGIAGLLGGVGLYAQSRNLDLSASRLEIALPPREP